MIAEKIDRSNLRFVNDFEKIVKRKLEKRSKLYDAKLLDFGNRNYCCNDIHNLKYHFSENRRKDVIVLVCKKCKRRHVRMAAETGLLGKKKS